MKTAALVAGLIVAAFYLLWAIYLAVMNLARAKDAGTLSRTALILGTPLLLIGFALDVLLNLTAMTLLLLELPRELTVSERLCRHNLGPDGWRRNVARWAEQLLDPFDPDGNHI